MVGVRGRGGGGQVVKGGWDQGVGQGFLEWRYRVPGGGTEGAGGSVLVGSQGVLGS